MRMDDGSFVEAQVWNEHHQKSDECLRSQRLIVEFYECDAFSLSHHFAGRFSSFFSVSKWSRRINDEAYFTECVRLSNLAFSLFKMAHYFFLCVFLLFWPLLLFHSFNMASVVTRNQVICHECIQKASRHFSRLLANKHNWAYKFIVVMQS